MLPSHRCVGRIILVVHGLRRSVSWFSLSGRAFDFFGNSFNEPSFVDDRNVQGLDVREPQIIHEKKNRLEEHLFPVFVGQRERVNYCDRRAFLTPWERKSPRQPAR